MFALAALLCASPPAWGQAVDQAKLAIVLDERAPLPLREQALAEVTVAAARARQPAAQGPLRDALGPLLDRLVARRADATHQGFTLLVLRALEVFRPYPDLAGRLRPLLEADAAPRLREAALRAVSVHAVAGLVPQLRAFLTEGDPQAPDRERMERTVLEAARVIPLEEGVEVAATALEASVQRGVRVSAAALLGERRAPRGREALRAAADLSMLDELVAVEAARALNRHGSHEGTGALVERLQARQASLALYRALCELSFHQDGFAGVPPGDFYEAGRDGRARIAAEVRAWWERAHARSPDDVLFDALAARGVRVPADRASKEAVTALIDGLTVSPSSLRYAALDRLVALTGRADLAEGFRTILRTLRGSVAMRETEPPEGWADACRQEALAAHQAERQEVWRRWWTTAAPRAERRGDRWVVP